MGYKVFIDFEMVPIDKEYKEIRDIYRYEVIQIGAVMLDDNDKEVDSFKRNIRPQYAKFVSNKLMDLLGITYRELEYCGEFITGWQAFIKWAYSRSDDITVYAWSNSDLMQVTGEMEILKYEIDEISEKMFNNWVDLQAEFDKVISATDQTGLKRALEICGIEFEGKQHDSLIDSRNTAAVYIELKTPEDIIKQIELTKKYTEEKVDSGCSLGSLIDFSSLGF